MAIVKQHNTVLVDADQRRLPRDLAGLEAELQSENPTVRRWAARDLAAFPDVAGLLVNQLKRESDASVREVILTTLIRLGDPAAVTGLVDFLRSEDAAVRNDVIEAMKELSDEVEPIMGDLLADADPDVRIFAVNILESLRHPQVESWLIGVIENDPHLNVCATALDLLSEVGSSASRSALQHLKTRFPDEPYICFAADLALKRIVED